MNYRQLRIAWSLAWAFVYLLLPTLNPSDAYGSPGAFFITPRQHLMLAAPALLLIAVPWIPSKYTLLDLLVAITLVAIVLGLFVYGPGK